MSYGRFNSPLCRQEEESDKRSLKELPFYRLGLLFLGRDCFSSKFVINLLDTCRRESISAFHNPFFGYLDRVHDEYSPYVFSKFRHAGESSSKPFVQGP